MTPAVSKYDVSNQVHMLREPTGQRFTFIAYLEPYELEHYSQVLNATGAVAYVLENPPSTFVCLFISLNFSQSIEGLEFALSLSFVL